MAAIARLFGSGGANLAPQDQAGSPSLATALRDIADDLAGIQPAALAADTIGAAVGATAAPTVGANIAAFTDPPSAAEMALLRTFVNALKADNAAQQTTIDTLIARLNQARADLLDVRAKLAATVEGTYTIKTTKA
jgi:hypothetical protein